MTVLFGFADAVGALLTEQPGAGPISWLAVGAGLAEWDTDAPPVDRSRTALTTEVGRVRLRPGREVVFRPQLEVIEIDVDLPASMATGPLREVGVFAGAQAGRPGGGVLVHHAVHGVEEHDEDDEVTRSVRLTLDPAWPAGARQLVGRLLAGQSGVVGLRWFVAGTSDADPPVTGIRLAAEAVRRPLDRRQVSYDAARRAVTVGARLELGEGPPELREIGVAGGDAGDGTGAEHVAVRVVVGPVDRRPPAGYAVRITIPLVERLDVAVPDLAGRPLDEVAGALREVSLVVGRIERREATDGDVGRVLDQRPAAGDAVNEGRPVDLVVGSRPLVAVPSVVGLEEDAARDLLTAAGFVVADEVEEVEVDQPVRAADGTRPAERTLVEDGSLVVLRLTVPRRVRVPDLRGRTPSVAAAVLSQIGLRLAHSTPGSVASSARPGTVVRQQPTAPREVGIGSTIVVTLSEPWSVEVPDLDGLRVEEVPGRLRAAAAGLLEKLGRPGDPAGLALGAVTPRPSTRTAGTVVDQEPAAGERRFLYGAVDIAVAVAQSSVVPDVRRVEQLAAAARLTEAGLVLGAVRRRPSRTSANGVVLEQRPPPDDEVAPGTAVDVVVSSGARSVVPTVLGRPVAVAIEMITSAGFGVAPLRRDAGTSDSVPGTVVFQVPAPGAQAIAGVEVELTVAVGVPRLVGRPVAEAVTELESLGYLPALIEQAVTEGAGTVLAQDPPAGTPADEGTVVTLTVGVSARVVVPALVGLPIEDAVDALAQLGLVLGTTSTAPADDRVGEVIDQVPAAGEEVARGTTVDVVVGAPVVVAVAVPDLAGRTQEEARAMVEGAGLAFAVNELRPTVEHASGTVVEQAPAAGTTVPPGSTVGVVIATEGVVTVPAVVGLTLGDAERAVAAVGLLLAVGRRTIGSPIVTSQNPAAGSQAVIGSTVLVTVMDVVPAPALEGQPIGTARAVASRLGLTLTETFELAGMRPGIVLSQEPLAGEPVPVGGTIAVVVSRFGRPGGEFEFERPEIVLIEPDPIGPIIVGPSRIPIERFTERPGIFDRLAPP